MGELQWPVPLAVAFELTEAKLQDGLGARKSPGSIVVMAGEQRASKEIARNGLGDLEYCGEEDGAKYVIRGSNHLISVTTHVHRHMFTWKRRSSVWSECTDLWRRSTMSLHEWELGIVSSE